MHHRFQQLFYCFRENCGWRPFGANYSGLGGYAPKPLCIGLCLCGFFLYQQMKSFMPTQSIVQEVVLNVFGLTLSNSLPCNVIVTRSFSRSWFMVLRSALWVFHKFQSWKKNVHMSVKQPAEWVSACKQVKDLVTELAFLVFTIYRNTVWVLSLSTSESGTDFIAWQKYTVSK